VSALQNRPELLKYQQFPRLISPLAYSPPEISACTSFADMPEYTACPSQETSTPEQQRHHDTSELLIESPPRSLEGSLDSLPGWERDSTRSTVNIDSATVPDVEPLSQTHTRPVSIKAQALRIIRARTLPLVGRLRWKKTWRIPVTIVGFYFLGI
jgi:hypothetical protein